MANITRARLPIENSSHSISPQSLERIDHALQITTASAAAYFYPVDILRGVLCGTFCRLIFSQRSLHPDPKMVRATQITSILFTVLFAVYTLGVSKAYVFAPLFLGFGAGITGHDLLQKYIG